MLVSELAERADVPLATVKYYLREGLLPAGETTGPRRSEYDETHVRRLRVLRLLREVGGVPVTSLRQVIEALEDEDLPVHEVMTLVADVISDVPEPSVVDSPSLDVVDEVLARIGWDDVRPESIDRQRLATLVSQLNEPGPLAATVEILTFYAAAADHVARAEVELLDHTVERSHLLEQLVTGSVVYGQVFQVLRQIGEQHHLARAASAGEVPVATR
jgi:DNA-binding transcriptional MerR regulator